MQQNSSKSKIVISALGEFYPFHGGIAKYAESLAYALYEDFSVCILAGPDTFGAAQEWDFGVVRRIRLTRFKSVRRFLGGLYLLNVARQKPHTLILTHPFDAICYMNVASIFKALSPQTHVIFCIYGTEISDLAEGTGLIDAQTFRQKSKYIDTFVTISSYVDALFKKIFPYISHNRIHILHPTLAWNIYELDSMSQSEQDAVLNKFNVEPGKYVLSIGRLYKRKGHHIILNDFEKILRKHSNMKYVIVGDGPERNSLLQLAEEKGIADSLVLTGEIFDGEKVALINGCAAYVHPSIEEDEAGHRVEGFGIAILEAFYRSKPAIVFKSGGMIDLVKNRKNGRVVKESDNIVKALSELLDNRKKQKFYGKAARESHDTQFSSEIFKRNLTSIIVQRKNVVYVTEWFYPIHGGAGRQALNLAENLKDQHTISFVSKFVPGSKRNDTHKGFTIHRFGNGSYNRIDDYLSAVKLFTHLVGQRKNIDVLHLHGNIENNFPAAAIIFAKLFRKKVIAKLSIHGEIEKHVESDHYTSAELQLKRANPLNWFRQWLSRSLNTYIAISNEIAKELESVGIDRNHILNIPNGVDTDTFKPATREEKKKARKSLKIKPAIQVYLCVARLVQHKGLIQPLLETWHTHFAKDPHKLLICVGSGGGLSSSIEDTVHTFVKDRSLENVRLEGDQDNVQMYYHAADMFVLPSENEGLSNALLEAASSGLICIASDVSGNHDVIQDGYGYLIQPGSSSELAQAIKHAATLSSRQQTTMTNLLREHILNSYDIRQTSQAISYLYS